MKKTIGFAAALLVAGMGAAFAQDGDAAAGAKVFNKCKACHDVPGPDAKNKVGPILTGVIGRTVGTAEGYKYSDGYLALGQAGKAWDEAMLKDYIADPKAFLEAQGVDGKSKMAKQKVSDEEFVNLVAFLKASQ